MTSQIYAKGLIQATSSQYYSIPLQACLLYLMDRLTGYWFTIANISASQYGRPFATVHQVTGPYMNQVGRSGCSCRKYSTDYWSLGQLILDGIPSQPINNRVLFSFDDAPTRRNQRVPSRYRSRVKHTHLNNYIGGKINCVLSLLFIFRSTIFLIKSTAVLIRTGLSQDVSFIQAEIPVKVLDYVWDDK